MKLRSNIKKSVIVFWAGLTFFSVWVCTLRFVYEIDGVPTFLYGLPSPWLYWSTTSSLEYIINVPNFFKNLAFNGFFCALALQGLKTFIKSRPKNIALLEFIVGILLLGGAFICFEIYGTYFSWDMNFPDEKWKIRETCLYFGLDRSYGPLE